MRPGKLRRSRWRATALPWESQWGEEGWEKTGRQSYGARAWENVEMPINTGSQNVSLDYHFSLSLFQALPKRWIITSPCLSSKLCQEDLRFFCKIALFFCNTTAEFLGQRQSKAWNFLHFAEAVCFLWGEKKERNKERKAEKPLSLWPAMSG